VRWGRAAASRSTGRDQDEQQSGSGDGPKARPLIETSRGDNQPILPQDRQLDASPSLHIFSAFTLLSIDETPVRSLVIAPETVIPLEIWAIVIVELPQPTGGIDPRANAEAVGRPCIGSPFSVVEFRGAYASRPPSIWRRENRRRLLDLVLFHSIPLPEHA